MSRKELNPDPQEKKMKKLEEKIHAEEMREQLFRAEEELLNQED